MPEDATKIRIDSPKPHEGVKCPRFTDGSADAGTFCPGPKHVAHACPARMSHWGSHHLERQHLPPARTPSRHRRGGHGPGRGSRDPGRRGVRPRDRRPRPRERHRAAHRARRLPAQQDRARPARGHPQRGAGARERREDRAHRPAGRRRRRKAVQRAARRRGRGEGDGHRREERGLHHAGPRQAARPRPAAALGDRGPGGHLHGDLRGREEAGRRRRPPGTRDRPRQEGHAHHRRDDGREGARRRRGAARPLEGGDDLPHGRRHRTRTQGLRQPR